ncbi:MAG: hypothetical protein FD139_3797 [Methylocystaceae bacterium]|nr:MAG: hypothetical protein FD139_3797 [Methylocystaceae bacterium]
MTSLCIDAQQLTCVTFTSAQRCVLPSCMNPTLTRKNRSRCIPTPSGRRTEITSNDIYGVFEPLSRHAQLTTKQLVAYDGQWLGRLGQEVKLANYLAHDEIHRLEADAAQLLITKGVIPNAQWVFHVRIGGHRTTPSRIIRLTHDHMASHIVLDIEIGARDDEAARFINHIEIVQAAPEATRALRNPLRIPGPETAGATKWIEPDALFALGSRYYAVEADMGTESIDPIIRAKILAYREVVASGIIDDHLGIDNLTVLFVTTNETRMRNIMKELRTIAHNGKTPMFAFASRPDLATIMHAPAPIGDMFRTSWERVGYEPLSLVRPN